MTTAQKMRIVGGIAFLVTLAGSIFSSALPSPLGAKIALVVAITAGAYAAWEAKPGGRLSQESETSQTSFLMRHAVLRVPLMGVMMTLFVYTAVGCGVFWLITEVIGHKETVAFTVTGSGSSRRSCQHINVKEAEFVPDHALCATDDLMDGAIPGRPVYLSGKMSVLGLNVDSISYTPPQ